MKLLLTGGTGYIGSHACVELLAAGHEVVIVDNLSNSSVKVLDRIEKISSVRPIFVEADVGDRAAMRSIFSLHNIAAVMHFSGSKSVGESCDLPLKYYNNNVAGTLALLEVMSDFGIKKMVFSSSASVYSEHNISPLDETMATSPTNPYGRTKLVIEEILSDLVNSDPQWSVISLRYFNPIGAHSSGLIGESPNGIPNNLIPYVAQVAVGVLPHVQVFGDDYETKDGTGVRDYIHVVDLAIAHLQALQALESLKGYGVINIGTGCGTSVLDIICFFSEVCKKDIPYKIVPRRPGDVATVYADASLANTLLDWHAKRDLKVMIEDTWRWQSLNPDGYEIQSSTISLNE